VRSDVDQQLQDNEYLMKSIKAKLMLMDQLD